MKKTSLIILSVFCLLALVVWFSCNPFQQANKSSSDYDILNETEFLKGTGDTSCVGFATVNAWGDDGTSGGAGGQTVTATNATQFLDYIAREEPLIIQVSGTISFSGMQNVASNKTIIGVGNAVINGGGGLNIGIPIDDNITSLPANAVHNIIIRNITFTGGSDDLINVQMFSHHIWIDHCDFSNSSDGAVDIKRGSNYCTVSWNVFHDHNKTCLLGRDDGDTAQDRGNLKTTYHHNWFKGTTQRHPRVRFAQCHVYNNYYTDIGDYGIGVGVEANIISENNYFMNVEDCTNWYDTSSMPGYIRDTGSVLINVETFEVNPSGVNWTPPYSYTLDTGAETDAIVQAGAGVGKI
ncbi:MAG: pectate lyase [Spirochaetes bacterium]|nr:pectate lyase [Spirochaetota bacterium]